MPTPKRGRQAKEGVPRNVEELRQLHVGKNREAQGWLAKARDAHGEGRAHYSMIIRMFSLTQDLVEGIAGSESFPRLKVP